MEQHYTVCDNDVAFEYICDNNQYFSDQLGECIHFNELFHNSGESTTIVSNTTSEITSKSEPEVNICAGVGNGERIGDPERCDAFYMCLFESIAIPSICRPGTYFNPETTICDADSQDLCRLCSGDEHGQMHRDPHSCTKFNLCFDGLLHLVECPDGLYFVEERHACEPEYDDCTTDGEGLIRD